MPLGDIAGEALGGVFRVIARIVFEIVVEWLLRGTGALILRVLRLGHAPGEAAAAVTGLAFWVAMIAVGVWIYRETG
ncbi:hypothetical protein D9M69_720340 [compost metagenome]|jgi:hypothetical protein